MTYSTHKHSNYSSQESTQILKQEATVHGLIKHMMKWFDIKSSCSLRPFLKKNLSFHSTKKPIILPFSTIFSKNSRALYVQKCQSQPCKMMSCFYQFIKHVSFWMISSHFKLSRYIIKVFDR